MMKKSEILRECARGCRKGWVRGRMDDHHGNHCAIGWIREVTGEDLFISNAMGSTLCNPNIQALADFVAGANNITNMYAGLRIPSWSHHGLLVFNDEDATAGAIVAEVFDRAADLAAVQELTDLADAMPEAERIEIEQDSDEDYEPLLRESDEITGEHDDEAMIAKEKE